MHIPSILTERFSKAISSIVDDPAPYAAMIRPSTDAKFGDYQCNAAMSLGKALGKPPREAAAEIVSKLDIADWCDTPEIAGPGFINLTISADRVGQILVDMLRDERLAVAEPSQGRKILVDFSSPNVAKPMHVGHIRSTVIGDCLSRLLRFLGADVITDNHLGDWGTQFGIIIYGYKHFGDPDVVAADPVPELAKLYRLTNRFIEYEKSQAKRPTSHAELKTAEQALHDAEQVLAIVEDDESLSAKERKKKRKAVASAKARCANLKSQIESAESIIAAVEQDATINQHLSAHQDVSGAVLRETAKLHEGDQENLTLWKQFLPHCKDEINRVYDRLEVTFDHVLGESFYHDRLAQTVAELERRGLAQQSDGAVCVFVEGFESPMIVRKRDGAFLYATTDLATLQYRHEHFGVQEILYVVDSRQSEHFQKFFALAEPLGFGHIKLVHVSFGTVLGSDGKPMKTRSGELIGLEGLLDDAVAKASQVVCDPQRLANMTPPMEPAEQQRVSEIIGIAAIKYADLSHDRTSDYRFDTDKMVAMEGNTATYIQYSYARTQSILRRVAQQSGSPIDRTSLVGSLSPECVIVGHPAERALIVRLVKLEEALRLAAENYAPNQLCDYLYETAKAYSVFNERCRVLDNQDPNIALTRQALVFLTGEVLKLGLGLLGISVVDRM